jgi:signal peptidase II
LKKDLKNAGKFFLFGLLLVFLDQITKVLFTGKYFDFGFFAINYVRNFGISFGLFQGINSFVIFVSFLALGFLYYYRSEFKSNPFLLTLIVSGIIGNLIDRIRVGFVIDFIDFKVWPVFNFADVYLVLGISLFIYFSYKNQKSSKSSNLSK